MKLSIIIPSLNEGDNITPTLQSIHKLSKHPYEIILVDGGSQDNTLDIAKSHVDTVIHSEKGRALQMNNGARHASGNILWFLHADSVIPDNADDLIYQALQANSYEWGRFDIQLSGSMRVFRVIERLINLRSRLTKISTGDQGIFVSRNLFEKINGYSNIPLMEDIELSHRLKKLSSPACLNQAIITSSRRWEKNGIIRTVLLMWYLRFAYSIGVPAEKLNRRYSN